MTLSFGSTLATPFYEGPVSASSDTPWYLPVSIGGRAYLIDSREYRRQTVPAQRESIDDGAEASDRSLSTTGSWRRSQHDFRGGAGQEYFDFSPEDRRDRFWWSKGIDVIGRRTMGLLRQTRETLGLPSSPDLRVYATSERLYYWGPDHLSFTTDPLVETPSRTGVAYAGTITGVVSDGGRFFFSTSDEGIQQVLVGSTSASQHSTFDANGGVYIANGRMLAAHDNRLVEVAGNGTAGGAELLDYTHLSSSFRWTKVIGGVNFILACGNDGDQGAIFAIPTDEAGSLVQPFAAATLPRGELMLTMEQYTSTLLLGTSRGFRLGQQGGQGGIQFGPLIEVGPVEAMTGVGEFVYFSWSNFDEESSGLGKADLSRFTEPLVPSYASNVMGDAQGQVTSIERWGQDDWVFNVDGKVFVTTESLVESGWYESSELSFGTFEQKAGRYISVRHDPLDGEVVVSVRNEEIEEFSIGSSRSQGSLSSGPSWRLPLQRFERFQLRIRLDRHDLDPTKGPELRRWTTSVIPTPERVDSFLVPLVLHSRIVNDRGDGAEIYQDTRREFNHLKSLEAAKQLVLYQEGVEAHEVYIDGLELRPAKWSDDQSFFEGLLFVRMLTSRPE